MSLKQKQGITSAEWEVELVVYLVYIIFKQLLEHTLQNEGSAVRLSDSDSSINYQRSQKLHRNHTGLTDTRTKNWSRQRTCVWFVLFFNLCEASPIITLWSEELPPPTPSTRRRPPSNRPTGLKWSNLLRAELSCHHHGKVQVVCLLSNTFNLFLKRISTPTNHRPRPPPFTVFSCAHWAPWSGLVMDWLPVRTDTLESRRAEIWDDLPKQQERLPPTSLLCLSIIRLARFPVKEIWINH